MRYISMDQAKPGMIVGKSVFNEEGKILVNYKVCLTEKLIGQMKEKKLQGLYISDELSKDINIEPLVSEELEQRATQVLHDMDIDAALEVASFFLPHRADRSAGHVITTWRCSLST